MNRQGLLEILDFNQILSAEEPGAPHPDGGVVFVRMPRFAEIEDLHRLTVSELGPNVASLEAMQDVYRQNPETHWCVFRSPTEDRAQAQLAGFYGFLHLNEAGYAALQARTLRPRKPDLTLLAVAGTRPAAVYIWAIIARRLSRLTIPLIGKGLGARRYGGLPFYATPATMAGLQGLKSYGFHGDASDDDKLGELLQFYIPGEADRPDRPASAA